MYLSSIQHGIQSLHCLQEMNNTYQNENPSLTDWAENHKTAIVLNGGTSEQMLAIKHLMEHQSNAFPWGYFNEPSLDNALTCVGIILPEYIYARERSDIGSFEYEISQLVRSKHFAR
jgi:hypothetical protein